MSARATQAPKPVDQGDAQPAAQPVHGPQQDIAALKGALSLVDSLVQDCTHQIAAICGAAQTRLAVDPLALADVHELLGLVKDMAQMLSNDVDCQAGDAGCSDAGNFASNRPPRALWEQWHSLTRAAAGTAAGAAADSEQGRAA